MPQASPELQADWPGYDAQAIGHLQSAGFTLNSDHSWTLPAPNYQPTARDISAVCYLMDEWDFGGMRKPSNNA